LKKDEWASKDDRTFQQSSTAPKKKSWKNNIELSVEIKKSPQGFQIRSLNRSQQHNENNQSTRYTELLLGPLPFAPFFVHKF
jgi:hypothetical protein